MKANRSCNIYSRWGEPDIHIWSFTGNLPCGFTGHRNFTSV